MAELHEIRWQTAAARGAMRRAWAARSKKERAQKLREADQQLGEALRLLTKLIDD